jgi:Ca-activated chloride channel family protein
MSHFSFQYPYLFGLIVVFWICARWCPARTQAIFFPHVVLMRSPGRPSTRLLEMLKWFGIVSLLVALASPVTTETFKNTKKHGRDIMLVIDSSGSMRQRGFDPADPFKTKFDAVKEVVTDFIRQRKNDRLGLINFADTAFVASPLTFEHPFLLEVLRMQRLGLAGRKTALNDALVQTYNVLSKSDAKTKIAILLTDGEDTASTIQDPNSILKLVRDGSIRLYTIGIGTRRDFNGPYLQALAEAGKGKFFAATDRTALQNIYAQIDALETSKIKNKHIVRYTYYYLYPLLAAILSLLGFVYLRSARGVNV